MIFLIFILNLYAHEVPVKTEFFIDSYYAYDFNRPADHERQYTTQPVRHNEFNLNLVSISGAIQKEKVRGKLTLQHGNSVVKNYSGEANLGATSGPNDSRHLQEAYVGARLSEKTWLDGGIYLGHIGMESWISKNNWVYSRSMMLDYVPYYQTGVRISHQIDEQQSAQLHIINGWQNISETNQDKAFGLSYNYSVGENLISYNNFIGRTAPAYSNKSSLRIYHDIYASLDFGNFDLKGSFDLGTQDRINHGGTDSWYAIGIVGRMELDSLNFLALRAEYFNDPKQIVAQTRTPNGFKTYSTSFNFDHQIDSDMLGRVEYRYFFSRDAIYPRASGLSKQDQFLATSLAVSF